MYKSSLLKVTMLCLMAGQMSDYARAESGFWPPAQPLLSRHQFSHALRAIDDLKGLSLDLYLDDAEYVVARRPEEVYGQHCLVTDAKTVARLAAIVSNLRMAKIESGLSNYRLRIRFSRSGEAVFDAVFTYPGEHDSAVAGVVNGRGADFTAEPVQQLIKFTEQALVAPKEATPCSKISG
ncbi:MAG: hypothetical protein WCA81_07655 [Rhizomicrobium sp.]